MFGWVRVWVFGVWARVVRGGNGLRLGFCVFGEVRAGCCCSFAAAVEGVIKGGIGWTGEVDVGGAEFGRRQASTAAVIVAVKVEMRSTRLEVSVAAANVFSGS